MDHAVFDSLRSPSFGLIPYTKFLARDSCSGKVMAHDTLKKHGLRRRKHKNSKLGCPNCKKRKVKCSEELPQCRNCVKHKVRCGYLDYPDDQLAELKQAKLSYEFESLSTVPDDPWGSWRSKNHHHLPYAQEIAVSFTKTPPPPNATARFHHIAKNPTLDPKSFYVGWMSHVMYSAPHSPMFFNCIINLITNYLVCTVFANQTNPVPTITQAGGDINTRVNIQSIEHYAYIIKHLRALLNSGEDPDLSAQVSFLLSMTSIYDPEATVYSMSCFRDGLFSVLAHHHHLSQLTFIPAHLSVMKTALKFVYMPPTPVSTVVEFLKILNSYISVVPHQYRQHVDELAKFIGEAVNNYFPLIHENLDNPQLQQETLFRMMHHWVRFVPPELQTYSENSSAFHFLAFLFFRTAKNMLFHQAPQIMFFFLQTFESVLATDAFVFPPEQAYQVWQHQWNRDQMPDDEARLRPQLKFTSAYLIRCLSYYGTRLKYWYHLTQVSKGLFPLDNVKSWMASVSDIGSERRRFAAATGMQDAPVVSFCQQYISRNSYPRVQTCTSGNGNPGGDDAVDFTTLNPLGFLEGDWASTHG